MALRSIKTMIPQLEKIFGVDGTLIYERQRALVKAGGLKTRAGQGPGSGAPATPKNLALLLLAIMASEKPMVGAARAKELAKLVPARVPKNPSQKCAFTGQHDLLSAIVYAITAHPDHGKEPSLVVSGDRNFAQLRESLPSKFGTDQQEPQVYVSPGKGNENDFLSPPIERTAAFDLYRLAKLFHSQGEDSHDSEA